MSIKILKSLLIFFILVGIINNTFARENTQNELTYVNFRDLRDLNPHLYSGELFAQNLLFESLIKIKNDGNFDPWLAKSWKISSDGKKYVFKLRNNVYFSDGVKFNAKTAKANFDAVLDNFQRHGWLESVKLMMKIKDAGQEPIQVTGEYELTIILSDSYYPFLTELGVTRPFRFISPQSFKDGTSKNGVTVMSGTGPYILKSNKIDQFSVFVRNEKYWGKKANIEKIVVKVIPDNQTRLLALENGEIDLIFGTNMIDAFSYKKFITMPKFDGAMSNPVSTRMMLLNTQHHILGDVRVRQAIQHATDKEKISKGIFSGMETPADRLFAENVPYSNIKLKPYRFDFQKARELLEQSGWKKISGKKYRQKNGKELNITINYDSNKVSHKNIAEFLKNEYKKVGIHITILGEEEQAYRDRMKAGNFEFIFNISWGLPYDPQSFLGAMRRPVYGDYFAQQGLKNKKELDDTILKALKSIQKNKRQKHYKYVLETLHNEAVYLPLTYQRNRAIFNKKVKDVQFNISKYEVPIEKMSIK